MSELINIKEFVGWTVEDLLRNRRENLWRDRRVQHVDDGMTGIAIGERDGLIEVEGLRSW